MGVSYIYMYVPSDGGLDASMHTIKEGEIVMGMLPTYTDSRYKYGLGKIWGVICIHVYTYTYGWMNVSGYTLSMPMDWFRSLCGTIKMQFEYTFPYIH